VEPTDYFSIIDGGFHPPYRLTGLHGSAGASPVERRVIFFS